MKLGIPLLVPFQGLARASPSPRLPGWTGNPSGANDSPSTWQNHQGCVMTIFTVSKFSVISIREREILSDLKEHNSSEIVESLCIDKDKYILKSGMTVFDLRT